MLAVVRSELVAGSLWAVVVGERVRVERARVSDGADVEGGERDARLCVRVVRRVVKALWMALLVGWLVRWMGGQSYRRLGMWCVRVREGMLSKMHLIVRPQMRHMLGDGGRVFDAGRLDVF